MSKFEKSFFGSNVTILFGSGMEDESRLIKSYASDKIGVRVFGDGHNTLSNVILHGIEKHQDEHKEDEEERDILVIYAHGSINPDLIDGIDHSSIIDWAKKHGFKAVALFSCHAGASFKKALIENHTITDDGVFVFAFASRKHKTLTHINTEYIKKIIEFAQDDELLPLDVLKNVAKIYPGAIYAKEKNVIQKYPAINKFSRKDIETYISKSGIEQDDKKRMQEALQKSKKLSFDIKAIRLLFKKSGVRDESINILARIAEMDLEQRFVADKIDRHLASRFDDEKIQSTESDKALMLSSSLLMVVNKEGDDVESLRWMLKSNPGYNLNYKYNASSIGYTLLMRAVQKGNIKIFKELIAAKADPNIKDNLGKTAIEIAIDEENLEMVKALIEADADIDKVFDNMNEENFKGKVMELLLDEDDNNLLEILSILADKKQDQKIEKIFDFFKEQEEQNGPYLVFVNKLLLDVAKNSSYGNLIPFLINQGANPDIRDISQDTPLHLAIKNKNNVAVKNLLDVDADMVIEDSKGNGPFILAMDSSEWEIFLPFCKKIVAENRVDVFQTLVTKALENPKEEHWCRTVGLIINYARKYKKLQGGEYSLESVIDKKSAGKYNESQQLILDKIWASVVKGYEQHSEPSPDPSGSDISGVPVKSKIIKDKKGR